MARRNFRRFAAKALRRVGAALLVLLVAVVIAVNLAPSRRFIARKVTAALTGVVSGTITIEELGHVGLTGVSGVRARLSDGKGRTLVTASGVSAHLRLFTLLRSVVHGPGLDVHLDSVSIDHVDANLDADDQGLLVARAFTPPEAPADAPPSKPSTLKLTIDEARLGSAWLHGRPSKDLLADADLNRLRLGFAMAGGDLKFALSHLDVRTRGAPFGADVVGTFVAHAELPPAPRQPSVDGTFEGTVGGARASLRGSMLSGVLAAHLAANATPGTLSALVPALRLRNPAELEVEASGTLPDVRAKGTLVTGSARASVNGSASVGSPLHGHVDLEASGVDLAAILASGPASDLNVHARADATLEKSGAIVGRFDVETKPARVGTETVPALSLHGKMTGYEGDAALDIAEPGTKTHVTADFDLRKKQLAYDASVSVPDFTAWKRLPGGSRGSASVRVRGTGDLGARTVSADVRANLANVSAEGLRVRKVEVGAVVDGPLSDPSLNAKIVATSVAAAGRTFEAAALSVHGTRDDLRLGAALDGSEGTPDVDLSTRADLANDVVLRKINARIGGADPLFARVEQLRIHGDDIQADGVTVDGAGAPISAAVHIAPRGMDIRAISAGFDVGAATRALGLASKGAKGKLSLDVDLKTRGQSARGKVGLELTSGAFAGVSDLGVLVATEVDGRRCSARIGGRIGGGHVDIDAQELTLAGSPFAARSWAEAEGTVHIDSDADLERLAKVLPTAMIPFDDMGGRVALNGVVERGHGDELPKVTLTVHTDGFRASAKSEREAPHDGTQVRAAPAWHTDGVDVEGSLALEKDGRTTTTARFRDATGELASVDASIDLPYHELVDSRVDEVTALSRAPFRIKLAVPRRRLSKLPPILATSGVDGDVELALDARSTGGEPALTLDGKAIGLRARGTRRGQPVDVQVNGKYGDGHGELAVDVDANAKRALSLRTNVNADAAALLHGGTTSWDATVSGKFDEFPLQAISVAGTRRIKGSLSGTLDAATGTRTPPHARAKLQAVGVSVGRERGPGARASLDANVDDHSVDAKVRFDQTDGFAEATASAGLTWSGPLAPKVDPAKNPARARADAKHFRLSVLRPLVQTILADLDGRVDANANFEATSIHGAPKLDGKVVLDQGTFELPATGQEFHDVHASVTLKNDGTLDAEQIVARGPSGTLNASGGAVLDGLSLKRAHLQAKIPSGDPFPISLQGQSFAKASGNLTVTAVPVPNKDEIDVTVDVPTARVVLFDKSAHDLQALDQDPHVRVGYHRTPGEFVVVPLERPRRLENNDTKVTALVATVKLHDVEIVRGTDLRVRLEGQPKIRAAEETSLSGEISLRSGYLYVQGKKFEIESGTISFVGEPDNPNVIVTAAWTAPEGTRVYADFVGPLKTGKVTLRSEPAHSKSEILSLILFGTPDGMGASSNSSSPEATAASVAGGVATQGLNRALDDMTGLDITTRIDTSDSSNPRPELEVRVARDVTVAVSHVLGVPPPGTNPDLNYATVDFRFARNWSLDTTMGDEGSSMLDLLWMYRY